MSTPETTLLHRAAYDGDIETITRLLDDGGDVDCRNCHGQTPLDLAVKAEKTSAVRLLLERGADPNAVSLYYLPVFHLAAQRGFVEILRLLLRSGADIEARSETGFTPLFFAVGLFPTGHLELPFYCLDIYPATVRFLLEQGADINARDNDGCTPLHRAAVCNVWSGNGDFPYEEDLRGNDMMALTLLLQHGADTEIRNDAGKTALEEALALGKHERVELLRKAATKNSASSAD